jgi:hypothetical protein
MTHVLGMSLYPRDRFGHVRHERCLVRYQVIGREECNDRVRIVSDDPASRVENSGGRPAIERLGQDGRADRGRELFVDVAGVAAGRDHHRAYASDHEGDSVQGLSKKGTLAELRHILLGPIGPHGLADQWTKAKTLPPGPALWPSCLGFAQGPGPCDLSSSRRLSHVAEQAVGRATTVEANPPAVCIRVRAFAKQLPKVHRWATRRSLRCVSITPSPTANPCRRRSYLLLFANRREGLACPNLRGRLLPAPRSPQKLEASEPSFGKCIVGFDRWVCEGAEPKGTSGRTGESAAATSKARTQTASGDAGSGDALQPPRDPAQVWPPAMAQNICCRETKT